MSNVRPIDSQRQRRRQATEWIARMDRELSPQERADLQSWIQSDHRNEMELLECAKLWDMMGALQSLGLLMPRTRQKAAWRPVALAASLVITLVTALLVLTSGPGEQLSADATIAQLPDQAMYTTPVGDQSTVHLNDGSVVQLNTDTRLQVRMTSNLRLLTLERGEIHINVAHDPNRPLRVIAGNQLIEAVGTAFNVKIDEHMEVEIIVTEGRVRVKLPPHALTVAQSETPSQTVDSGERVVLDESPEIEPLAEEDIEVKLAWREGMLVFRGSSLIDAVREVGRYTQVEFVIQSEDLKKRRVAGVFRAGDIDGFLASLRANFDVVDQQTDKHTITLSLKSDDNKS